MIVKRLLTTNPYKKREKEFMNMKTSFLNILFLLGVTLLLANCSSNTSSTAAAGSCSSGQVYTSMGCLTTNTSVCGTTAYGYWSGGSYNGTYYNAGCYPATSTASSGTCSSGYVYTQMGCLTQNTSTCGSSAYGYWSGGTYNGTYINAGCYAATTTSTATTSLTCNASDYVQTAMGSLQAGSCATYCSQYGKRYGYYNGMCYPSIY
jgi:hypothetical protein